MLAAFDKNIVIIIIKLQKWNKTPLPGSFYFLTFLQLHQSNVEHFNFKLSKIVLTSKIQRSLMCRVICLVLCTAYDMNIAFPFIPDVMSILMMMRQVPYYWHTQESRWTGRASHVPALIIHIIWFPSCPINNFLTTRM